MVKFKCPYTKEVISNKNQIGSYIRHNRKKYNISSDELRYNIYRESFGEIASKEIFENYYEVKKYSLPMFLSEFKMSYGITQFLINYHNLNYRTSKEANKIGAQRGKITNINRYGVDQTFKVKEFDEKRKNTYRKKYGVDNPFTNKTCIQNLDDLYIKKYGIGHKEYKSLKSKNAWSNKTDLEKNLWLAKTICSDKSKLESKCSIGKNQASKPEILIGKLLLDDGLAITSQFRVSRYPFDYKLTDYNILIEFNGDLFHANPRKYFSDDMIPIIKKTASEVWKKDADKIKMAELRGYQVVVIWEDEIKNKTDDEIKDLIYYKISNLVN